MGHIPMFCDWDFCDISQALGILSLGASEEQIKAIGAIYWYTIEFGLAKQWGEFKFYGAGIASSKDEINNF